MWDTHNFEAPKLVPQVISINLYFSYVSDLMFLDLLASPKTPFPNIEEITFVDNELSMCRPRHLQALLDRYKTTLRVLNLTCNSDTPVLTLPPTLEHFKFTVSNSTSLNNFCHTLSFSTLRTVSINFQDCYYLEPPPDTTALDKVLAGMPGLEKLELKVILQMKNTIDAGFPSCLGKHADGQLRLVWHVKKLVF